MTHAILIMTSILSVLLILLLVLLTAAGIWRRRDPLPHDMFDGDWPAGELLAGHYIGTWRHESRRPFKAAGFLSGGRGGFYLDGKGVNFLIDGIRQPIHWPYQRILSAEKIKWDKGAFNGRDALCIRWRMEEKVFDSVFVLPNVPLDEPMKRLEAGLKSASSDASPADGGRVS